MYARQDVLLGHILHARLVVILRVIPKHNSINLVGRPAQPALLDVVQDDLDLGLGAGEVGHVADRDAQAAAQDTAEMRRRVRQLVLLAVAAVEGDEDAHVVLARQDLDRGTGELGRDLVETAGANALLGAGDVEGADGRVVRSLLGQVGDADRCLVGGGAGVLRDGDGDGRRVLFALGGGLEAGEAALGAGRLAEPGSLDGRSIVLSLPVALSPGC